MSDNIHVKYCDSGAGENNFTKLKPTVVGWLMLIIKPQGQKQ